ncbi:ABC transporter ATP-binding protein [Caldicellulosiruptor sp. DIB 104C]|uniref:ABC transporter ATP-binding protein n=2 Tax=unclassified Caldicellulosiruptor TaxID=2622462 RepID=UPI002306D7E9|nr:ATP-binding cassette domain-containing protein [Caldicellulosiruptor sp. DIB 104C]
MNLLRVNNLYFGYRKGEEVLKNISFEVTDGITCILGPNGCGKTTLMKILATLLKYGKGQIIFNDLDYANPSQLMEIRKLIGYLPQRFEAYSQLTAKEFLYLTINLKCDKKFLDKTKMETMINEIIEVTGLGDYACKKIKTYSGGIKQRLGIAQALIGESRLIIVDEPTASIDVQQRKAFKDLINSIKKERCILISTHLLEDVEVICDNLIVMNKGVVEFCGKYDKFLQKYEGCIWKIQIDKQNYSNLKKEFFVIEERDFGKYIEIKVYSLQKPALGNVEECLPTLSDAYYLTLNLKGDGSFQ